MRVWALDGPQLIVGYRMTARFDVPLEPTLVRELVDFWTYIWDEPPDVPYAVYVGSEVEHNEHSVFLVRNGDRLVGTCTLNVPRAVPTVSDLGAVATHPDFRNRGLSTRVCEAAGRPCS